MKLFCPDELCMLRPTDCWQWKQSSGACTVLSEDASQHLCLELCVTWNTDAWFCKSASLRKPRLQKNKTPPTYTSCQSNIWQRDQGSSSSFLCSTVTLTNMPCGVVNQWKHNRKRNNSCQRGSETHKCSFSLQFEPAAQPLQLLVKLQAN